MTFTMDSFFWKLKEVFGTGTACVVTPVGELKYKDEIWNMPQGQVGSLTQRFFDAITSIQYGKAPDIFGWVRPIESLEESPVEFEDIYVQPEQQQVHGNPVDYPPIPCCPS